MPVTWLSWHASHLTVMSYLSRCHICATLTSWLGGCWKNINFIVLVKCPEVSPVSKCSLIIWLPGNSWVHLREVLYDELFRRKVFSMVDAFQGRIFKKHPILPLFHKKFFLPKSFLKDGYLCINFCWLWSHELLRSQEMDPTCRVSL